MRTGLFARHDAAFTGGGVGVMILIVTPTCHRRW